MLLKLLFVVIKLASPGLMCSPEEAGGWAGALNAGMAQVVQFRWSQTGQFSFLGITISAFLKCNIGPDFQILLLCVYRHHGNFVFQMTVGFFCW